MFNGEKIRIGKPDAAHLYNVDVIKDGIRGDIEVDAANRDQAGRLARKEGFEVHSVNMIG